MYNDVDIYECKFFTVNNKEKIESDPLTVSVREKIAPEAPGEDFTSGIIASEKPGLKEDKFVAPERYKEPDDRDVDPVSSETNKDGGEYETTPV